MAAESAPGASGKPTQPPAGPITMPTSSDGLPSPMALAPRTRSQKVPTGTPPVENDRPRQRRDEEIGEPRRRADLEHVVGDRVAANRRVPFHAQRPSRGPGPGPWRAARPAAGDGDGRLGFGRRHARAESVHGADPRVVDAARRHRDVERGRRGRRHGQGRPARRRYRPRSCSSPPCCRSRPASRPGAACRRWPSRRASSARPAGPASTVTGELHGAVHRGLRVAGRQGDAAGAGSAGTGVSVTLKVRLVAVEDTARWRCRQGPAATRWSSCAERVRLAPEGVGIGHRDREGRRRGRRASRPPPARRERKPARRSPRSR